MVVKGRRKSSSGEEEGEEKMLCSAPIIAGGGGQHVFSLTPGSGGDRRVVYANESMGASVCVPAHVVAGLIRQHFLGTWEKALVARKKQPAVLKQYQLCGNCQGDQSKMQRSGEKK